MFLGQFKNFKMVQIPLVLDLRDLCFLTAVLLMTCVDQFSPMGNITMSWLS